MIQINWKVRIKSKTFWVQIFGAFLFPILLYNNIEASSLTTWHSVGSLLLGLLSNPFLLFTVGWNVICAIISPTSSGLSDTPEELAKK
ncbi:phage holin [Bacillus altitudinis]|uniref:phage holin n=1 Tax=Bacillus altitudinis TaxID=293387 RepID=UPI003D237180